MNYGICLLAVLPVRESPSDKAEMTSQLLFGEHFEVLNLKNSWMFIRSGIDNYTGWINNKAYTPITETTYTLLLNPENNMVIKEITNLTKDDGTNLTILPGSSLPSYNPDSFFISIEKNKFLLKNKPLMADYSDITSSILDTAMLFINAPYMWGGRSFFGIDCSGFTQIVFKINRIKISRNAYDQSNEGREVNDLNQAKTADLVFFKNEDGKVNHTGILLENRRIIHASARVRIDRIDKKGIFNEELVEYTHHLHSIRRFLA